MSRSIDSARWVQQAHGVTGLRESPRGYTRHFLRAVSACAAIALLAGCSSAAPSTLPSTPPSTEPTPVGPDVRLSRSDVAMAELVDRMTPGCSAAVGVRGEVMWAAARGLGNLDALTPLTVDTRFELASVSKQFTATAILMLQREGKLSLTDPVASHISGLPAWGSTVTLSALMHHTSQIPDYWKKLDDWGIGFSDPASQAETVRAIAAVPRLLKGTGYAYSNSNYVLLAEVVHQVTGMELPQYLDENIFTPLGLKMTVSPAAQADDIALSYDDDNALVVPAWQAYGPTGIHTTPSELARWGDQYRTGSLVQDDFASDASEISQFKYYAAGIAIHPDGTLRHDGRWGGTVTAFWVSADRDTTITVFCAGHLANRYPLLTALRTIWDTPQGD